MREPGSTAAHWNDVYRRRGAHGVSWFLADLATSLALLDEAGLSASSRVIDVGGGASTLVDALVARGVASLAVLDLSETALALARERVGRARVEWIVGDVRTSPLAGGAYDFWHDRAVLHFLVDPADVAAYARQAAHALCRGGHAVIAGFAPDGPERCSGLPVARRSAGDIAAAMGPSFEFVAARDEVHVTPVGATQAFAYSLLRRR